jgi:hypothetical protein
MTRSGDTPDGEHQSGLAALIQEIRGRILNCGANGCLLAVNRALAVGTVATLNVSINGRTFSDVVRVVRCRKIDPIKGRHHVAAEFLSVTPPYEGSLRNLMQQEASVVAEHFASGGPDVETKFLPGEEIENDDRKARCRKR